MVISSGVVMTSQMIPSMKRMTSVEKKVVGVK